MIFTVYNRQPSNVFTMFGTDENSATFALGYVLAKCPAFAKAFLQDFKLGYDEAELKINLQKYDATSGVTDIEIEDRGFHLIIEAKKDWQLPSKTQLSKYARRFKSGAGKIQMLLTLSAASAEYARRRLSGDLGKGVVVDHRSWSDVQKIAAFWMRKTRGRQKIWLTELNDHLEGYVSMQDLKDNTVYVVSLSKKNIRPDRKFRLVDVVEKDHCYFRPVGGKGGLKTPPNYIGFRWDGRLQSVHHVASHEIVANPRDKNPRWSDNPKDHFLFQLGPAMKPPCKISSGNIRSRPIKCAIDTLLSGQFATILEAEAETKKRK